MPDLRLPGGAIVLDHGREQLRLAPDLSRGVVDLRIYSHFSPSDPWGRSPLYVEIRIDRIPQLVDALWRVYALAEVVGVPPHPDDVPEGAA